jgi:hypothetical protein
MLASHFLGHFSVGCEMSAAQPSQQPLLEEQELPQTNTTTRSERAAYAVPSPPRLRIVSFRNGTQPRRFARVPTHAVGPYPEQRKYPRATLKLPLKLCSVAGVAEAHPVSLVTRDISSTGVYFLCPRNISPGTPIELEVALVERPLGRGNVVMGTLAHVQRVEPAATPGWYGIAASFDDVEFDRDDLVPSRFRTK